MQLWVAATLYDSAVVIHERVLGPVSDDEADLRYREAAALGTALQLPAELWPPDRAAFRQYWDEQLASACASPEVQAVAHTLLDRRHLPVLFRGAFPLIRRLSVGLLPPGIAALLALDWTDRDARLLDRDLRRMARLYPVLPAVIRHAPQRYYLARLRRAVRTR